MYGGSCGEQKVLLGVPEEGWNLGEASTPSLCIELESRMNAKWRSFQ